MKSLTKDKTTASTLETQPSLERVCFYLFGIAQAVFAECGRIAFCGQPLVPADPTTSWRAVNAASDAFDR